MQCVMAEVDILSSWIKFNILIKSFFHRAGHIQHCFVFGSNIYGHSITATVFGGVCLHIQKCILPKEDHNHMGQWCSTSKT